MMSERTYPLYGTCDGCAQSDRPLRESDPETQAWICAECDAEQVALATRSKPLFRGPPGMFRRKFVDSDLPAEIVVYRAAAESATPTETDETEWGYEHPGIGIRPFAKPYPSWEPEPESKPLERWYRRTVTRGPWVPMLEDHPG
jgi:hypothetical protein